MLKKVLIARPLPEVVLAEARKHFDVVVRQETKPMSQDEMLASLRDFDGVMLGFAGSGPLRDVPYGRQLSGRKSPDSGFRN